MALTYTPEQIAERLDKLKQPFHPKDVQWRVTNKSQDGKKGMVAAYADPRAYSARLNEVFTPAGWSFELVTETTTGLTRMRHGKSVPTGKVSVIATLEIFGISKKASSTATAHRAMYVRLPGRDPKWVLGYFPAKPCIR